MAQDQNLHILGGSAASEQPEPAEDCDTEQIQQSEQHGSRSCHDHAEPTKPQLTGLVTSFGTLQVLLGYQKPALTPDATRHRDQIATHRHPEPTQPTSFTNRL